MIPGLRYQLNSDEAYELKRQREMDGEDDEPRPQKPAKKEPQTKGVGHQQRPDSHP